MDFELLQQDTKLIKDSFKTFVCKELDSVFYGDDKETIISRMKLSDHNGLTAEELEKIIENIKDEDLHQVELSFQKPDFRTNTLILSQAFETSLDGKMKADTIAYNRARIFFLVKGWSLTSKGKPLPVTVDNINKLHPNVIDAILEKLNKNIPHYFGSIAS